MAQGNHTGMIVVCSLTIAIWFSVTWDKHASFAEHPFESILTALAISGAVALLLGRSHVDSLWWGSGRGGHDFSAIPLEDSERQLTPSSREPSPHRYDKPQLTPQKMRISFLFIVICIIIRIELTRRILRDFQCSRKNIETIFLPVILALYDSFTAEPLYSHDGDVDMISNSVFEDIYYGMTRSKTRYLLPTILLSLGVYLAAGHTSPSTYICAKHGSSIVLLQFIDLGLDSLVIIAAGRVLKDINNGKRRLRIIGAILMVSTATVVTFTTIYLLFQPGNSYGILNGSSAYKWSVFKDTMACTVILLSVISLMSDLRPIILIVGLVFFCVYAELLHSAFSTKRAFPPQSTTAMVLGMMLLFLGFIIFIHIHRHSEFSTSSNSIICRVPGLFWILLTTSFVVTEGIYLSRSNVVGFHPINLLMYNSRISADRWLTQASSSNSLQVAVTEYRSRYHGRAPPPNFDKWYAFAKERGCLVIDEYDQIDRDLLPFWAIEPAKIRQRTTMEEVRLDIVGITIRNGHAEAGPVESPDGGWLINETVTTINKFAEWLPDLNIVINVKNVPLFATPWNTIEELRRLGRNAKSELQEGQSTNSSWSFIKDWPSFDMEKEKTWTSEHSKRDINRHLTSNFDDFVAPSCSSKSQARNGKYWNHRDFCVTCSYPHSMGQFISNWTLSGDLCHQPDLASLHGFLMSPGPDPHAGHTNDVIDPIFSLSKVQGYNDILFPGPMDGFTALSGPLNDRLFSELEDALFWRGQTGKSSVSLGSWQGMEQQRLVHLANKESRSNIVTMLLPSSTGKFVYEDVSAGDLAGLIKMNIGLTNITDCQEGDDCTEQMNAHTIIPDTDLNTRWGYRYLFSMDTSGAPDDFIPILSSNSLPFRSSIFRSWYDDRLTPWLHYIPQDGRLQAVHSTLAYFMGIKGKINGREVEMKSRADEAQFIADQGKKWAEKALRKEDAEAYLFRLLLEWARVVDDQRNVIGYTWEG